MVENARQAERIEDIKLAANYAKEMLEDLLYELELIDAGKDARTVKSIIRRIEDWQNE